jgi:tyrosyl-tRNA synthetase
MTKPDTKTLLERGVVEVIEKDHLEEALRQAQGKRPLRVKFGIDPTAPDLHLGHTVGLRKLRQFQDAGHQVVLIIGDFTARIGDPTGKTKARVPLTEKEIKTNLKNYLKQAGKVLDLKKIESHYNSKWFAKNPKLLMEIMSAISIVRALERDDFQKRIKAGGDVTLLEALYSGLQGYDSVEIRADVEVGATEQKFNMLMGRRMQRRYEMPEQDVMTIPILEGLDGVHKMSKSLGNYIGLDEEPAVMYGKVMSVPDGLIVKYAQLLTDLSVSEMESLAKSDPRSAKMKLAREIVSMYHNEKSAKKAEEEFIRVVSGGGLPEEIPSYQLPVTQLPLVELLVKAKLALSKSEARRLIEQGGVKIDGERQDDSNKMIALDKEILLQVGKRKFLKVNGHG